MWNSARGVWEKPETANLLCEHSELYSETWQNSGMMRDGMVFELQMPAHPIKDSESLSLEKTRLPTPVTTDWDFPASDYGVRGFRQLRDIGNILNGFYDVPEDSLLRTPAASEAERGHQPEEKSRARGGQVTLSGQLNYLPTPNTMDDLPARDESKIDRSKGGFSNVRETVMRPNFDRFEPAIKRWEEVTGLLAPAPTKPNGKDGAQRLSSQFTEWMMGLRPGWVTGHGLSRKDELKACGNGVVPQQAELALRLLLEVDDGADS